MQFSYTRQIKMGLKQYGPFWHCWSWTELSTWCQQVRCWRQTVDHLRYKLQQTPDLVTSAFQLQTQSLAQDWYSCKRDAPRRWSLGRRRWWMVYKLQQWVDTVFHQDCLVDFFHWCRLPAPAVNINQQQFIDNVSIHDDKIRKKNINTHNLQIQL